MNNSAKALDFMAAHQIPPTPDNYAVWFRYAAGQDPKLTAAIDDLLKSGTEFNPVVNAKLYETISGGIPDAQALHEAGARLQDATQTIMAHVREAGEDAASQGSRIADLSGGLAMAEKSRDIAGLAKTLAAEAKKLAETNSRLEERLSNSSAEIEKLQSHLETLRREATTDALTGLANRKALDSVLHEATLEATVEDRPLSFMLADIDHFKRFNDLNGHAVGDQVIKLVAKSLRENLKGQDLPARYGGEEFAVVLPNTGLADAATLANHLREAIAGRTLRNRKTGKSFGHVTISIGVASYRPGEDISALFERADAAMYRAKRNGRNQVAVEHADDETAGVTTRADSERLVEVM